MDSGESPWQFAREFSDESIPLGIFTEAVMHDGEERLRQELKQLGIVNAGQLRWNLNTPSLYEQAIIRREGELAHLGPLVVRTGHHTARAANDKYIVDEPSSTDKIWWGKVNEPISEERFESLYNRVVAYLQGRELFVQDVYAGADPNYRQAVRVVTETAWHNLFARNMFIRIQNREDLKLHKPEFTVLHVPHFHARPDFDRTNSETFIVVHFGKKLVIIGGTSYAGEIKKSVFTYMNYLLPQENVLSMHCSANVGENDDVALFFGLSGTGKTTLSADPERRLIGDDEHGWSDDGVFNFEGGCYAKVIRLSEEAEPDIFETTRSFGTVLENVALDCDTRRIDLDDGTLTENTRAAYPITHIETAIADGVGTIPRNVVMLTYDAFGVMPPISRMTPQQAMYHFISGYTAKVGGTEKGIGSEPKTVFSACFGAPFMALHPSAYAKLLEEKISKYNVRCWLINTGMIGGVYGVGSRVKIAHTRAMVKAALTGQLDDVKFVTEPVFGLAIPEICPGVKSELLNPKNAWADPEEYDKTARKLADSFRRNFREYEQDVSKEVLQAGPRNESITV
jgi:phosphoenolpyruvate carboxykinase (ATP)